MIKVLLFDFARVFLFPKDESYLGKLNDLYKTVKDNDGFNFDSKFYFNEELIEYLKNIKGDFRMVMFTSEIIQNDTVVKNKLDGLFEEIISAKEIGLSKSDPKAYEIISSKLGCDPDEILFIDDWEENVKSAVSIGMNTHLFKDTDELIKTIESGNY
jgi:HAD superfamily hydrolase (TIGR01509 family)